ncbi:MAG: hypothetical protein FWG84_03655 [Bacteroidales bacterium]|nr:hypothetical protein [Bacteroidales bacterium]
MKYSNIREEELKNKVEQDFFGKFDCTEIIKNIDFAVKDGETYLLWAEAKRNRDDILAMLAQLVLTIGKARTFDEILPPPFLGCYDNEKIAFVPYSEVQDIFYQNDFNWKVAPSDHETREFKQIYAQIENVIQAAPWQTYIFDFERDEKELKRFIRENFVVGKTETSKIRIDKNNFITIYNKWIDAVKPTIVADWDLAKKAGIIDGDFYLADLLSIENETIGEKLHVLLKTKYYEFDKKRLETGFFTIDRADFNDNQKAHTQFWNKYDRPPKEEYWNYIVDRRDLIVPQDIRERKGSFYTPGIWVELSQKYLADVLGEDWQDEYHVWDCAAGTGNLLVGLTNKYNIWASTLDKQDVDVMKYRIQNGANLLESHVFQFDFLNDDFSKLPQGLQDIINDPKRREKLIIYINPPYAEADNRKGERRIGVAESQIHKKYSELMGYTKRELYIQFLTRIYKEIPNCKIGEFSKLKALQAPRFYEFRNFFKAKLKRCFIVPADSFDNVKGQFPIGFKVWDTDIKADFKHIKAEAFNLERMFIGYKEIWNYDNQKLINDWVKTFRKSDLGSIATIIGVGSDFQNQRLVRFGEPNMKVPADNHHWQITANNLIETCIYFTVRKIIPATWLNDRDQFLYPNNGWETDNEFQNDCLAYTLFNNNISSKHGANHWIPFTENEVNACDKFDSHFMIGFLSGKIIQNGYSNLFEQEEDKFCIKREFSKEATSVFDAGRELWRYYHTAISSPFGGGREGGAVNASLYDIREYFQGRSDKGTMNNKSDDETYNELIENLRIALKTLANKIEPKVYEYGFLKE